MVEIKTVNSDYEEQIAEQNADTAYNKVMDASKAMSDEASRIRRVRDDSKAKAVAITYNFETGKVFYTYDA